MCSTTRAHKNQFAWTPIWQVGIFNFLNLQTLQYSIQLEVQSQFCRSVRALVTKIVFPAHGISRSTTAILCSQPARLPSSHSNFPFSLTCTFILILPWQLFPELQKEETILLEAYQPTKRDSTFLSLYSSECEVKS